MVRDYWFAAESVFVRMRREEVLLAFSPKSDDCCCGKHDIVISAKTAIRATQFIPPMAH
jgi:hypothetical protein